MPMREIRTMSRKAIAIRHLAFEDLGLLEPLLLRKGYRVSYREAGVDDLKRIEQERPDLLIILGAPISVNDPGRYPFLEDEFRLVSGLARAGTAVLGICLGAQVIARAWGAPVTPMVGKEIGFSSLELTESGQESVLAPLADGHDVLHWHGEESAPLKMAPSLAETGMCNNQAFQPVPHVLGLQFHLEVKLSSFERWLIGHCAELEAAGLDISALRARAHECFPALEPVANEVFERWLAQIER
jgi:GMP synthase - Glutamine amidotransferase domain